MYLYNADQIKKRDAFTSKKLGITSFELMTKAAKALSNQIIKLLPNQDVHVHLFCGNGNNGGDGMMIAKMLRNEFVNITVYECPIAKEPSIDYGLAEQEAKSVSNISFITVKKATDIPKELKGIVIDAILGSGVNRPVDGLCKEIIDTINNFNLQVLSIDLPSGLPVEGILQGEAIRADYTLTIEDMKSSFFYEENHAYVGKVIEVAIGLVEMDEVNDLRYIKASQMNSIFPQRDKFCHKGNFGHVLLICGCKGMAGAAILSGKGAIHSGAGLVTICVESQIENVLTTTIPEAMTIDDIELIEWTKYAALGIGCGLGQSQAAIKKIDVVLSKAHCPLIIDADALNIIAAQSWLERIPANTILTPHPGEFDRLFGKHQSHYERVMTQKTKAKALGINIILKNAHTSIACADGSVYFNTTGNPGMAKGGSGDVLTGYLSGLVAMLKDPIMAMQAAVFFHGLAGDKTRDKYGERSMSSSQIIEFL